ncbi:DUF2339 domain-containing protein [Deinobacterium chartae]|uniref:DUF2339 domain-containing protein n=1 Tax=Deinobacterium chartae TaxID=521158 RepID=UPI0031B5E1D1
MIAYVLLGAALGWLAESAPFAGLLLGAALGYLAWLALDIQVQLKTLRRDLEDLARRTDLAAGAEPTRGHAPTPRPVPLDTSPLSAPGEPPKSPPLPRPVPLDAPPARSRPAKLEGGGGLRWPQWLVGSSPWARVGAVLLFIGTGLLTKYAADAGLLPIRLRLAGVVIVALLLLGLGWRLRRVRRDYALVLQGTGIGLLYLTVYAGTALYHLLSPPAALTLLVALSAALALLATLQRAQVLAGMAAIGGFLAPVLSAPDAPPGLIFAYDALLGAGVLLLARARHWDGLSLLGFTFTFVIGGLWGFFRYRPEAFWLTELALIGFFLAYTLLPPRARDARVDAVLLFGPPLAFSLLQSALLLGERGPLTLSALLLALFYAARFAWSRDQRVPSEAYRALAVVFVTLSVPLGLEAVPGGVVWALEGVALAWAGRSLPFYRRAGAALQVAGPLLVLPYAAGALTLLWTSVLLGAAGLLTATLLGQSRPLLDRWLSRALGVWALLVWYGGGALALWELRPDSGWGAVLMYWSASALLMALLSGAGDLLRWPARLLLLPALPLLLTDALLDRPLATWAAAVFFAAQAVLLSRGLLGGAHGAGSYLLLSTLLTLEAVQGLARAFINPTWAQAALGAVPVACALLLFELSPRAVHVRRHATAWALGAALPLLGFGVLWFLLALGVPGDSAPLPFVPLLNPLDLCLLLVPLLGVQLLTTRGLRAGGPLAHALERWRDAWPPGLMPHALGVLFVLWWSAALLRAAARLEGIPYAFGDLLASGAAQAVLSLGWSVVALAAMLWARRSGERGVWVFGAVLLGAVLLKLFLVDLAGSGTLARVVSFVGVGLLMLLIGYLVPAPPRAPEPPAPADGT